jgi:hypothetical protein
MPAAGTSSQAAADTLSPPVDSTATMAIHAFQFVIAEDYNAFFLLLVNTIYLMMNFMSSWQWKSM